jgi:hypothetical protein
MQLRVFGAIAVVRCFDKEQTFPDGEWTVLVREASQTGVNALVAALDKPDAKPTTGACPAILIGNPNLVLVNAAGDHLTPTFPLDDCGQPQARIADIPSNWRLISSDKVQLQRSRAEITNHCQPAWKNELDIYAQTAERPGPGGPVLTYPDNKTLYVCIYQSPADDLTIGNYLRGLVLNGGAAAQLRVALDGAGNTGTCTPQRQFAVISTPSGAEVNVELGGCWRVQRDDSAHESTGTAQPKTIRTLLGLH